VRRGVIFSILIIAGVGLSQAAIPASEREALIALYNSTNGPGWTHQFNWRNATNTDFNDPGTECTWYGVSCYTHGDAVISLSFHNNQLSGSIPAELENLSDLMELSLQYNQLRGTIPAELGNLSDLRWLDLYFNQLSGSIPAELGNLSNLLDLFLLSNQLSGAIPPELGNLSSLSYLDLSENQLSGTIPPELGNLSNLNWLRLYSNQLSGAIPPELGNLSNLTWLYLYSNQLSGRIPAELRDLWNLQRLSLYSNALWTDDPNLAAFLARFDTDWDQTQTIPPAGMAASLPTSSSVVLDWTPIAYTGDTGGYAVFVGPMPWRSMIFSDGFESNDTKWWGLGNPWVTTTDKTDTSILVDGLAPGTTYDFFIRTITDPHAGNQNQVVSEISVAVQETTSP
jgi:hypothetical protein